MSEIRSFSLLLTAALATLGLAGCRDDAAKSAGGIALAQGDELTPEEKGRVVAKIGDETITLADFERRLNQQSPFARARYNSLERKREFLDSLVRFELLAREARKRGYDKDPDVVLAHKQAMVKRFTSEEVSNLVKMGDVTDAEVQAHYDAHPEEYDKPGEVRGAHILLPDEPAAKALLVEISAKVQAEPLKAREIFADYAKANSTDVATRETGGDLQFFGQPGTSRVDRGPMQPPVAPPVALAAFAIDKVGDVAPAPVKSSAGWHLVQKTGFRRPYKRELDDVKTSIRNKLFRERKGRAMQDFVQGLRDSAGVTIDEAVLEQVTVEAPKGPMPDLSQPRLPPGMAPPGRGMPRLGMPPGMAPRRAPADEGEEAP